MLHAAVERLADHQYTGNGHRLWRQASQLLDSERTRMRVGQVAVPFGICTEPSNVQAGGGACPHRLRCLGCGHFRTDASHLPELRAYLDRLRADRERVLASTELDDWAKIEAAPSTTEISKVRQLIHRLEHDLDDLTDEEHQQIRNACTVLRKTRQIVHLGVPAVPAAAVDVTRIRNPVRSRAQLLAVQHALARPRSMRTHRRNPRQSDRPHRRGRTRRLDRRSCAAQTGPPYSWHKSVSASGPCSTWTEDSHDHTTRPSGNTTRPHTTHCQPKKVRFVSGPLLLRSPA